MIKNAHSGSGAVGWHSALRLFLILALLVPLAAVAPIPPASPNAQPAALRITAEGLATGYAYWRAWVTLSTVNWD